MQLFHCQMSGSGEAEVTQQQGIGYDEKIDFLVTGTGEIKRISKAIGQELEDHRIMLDDVSHEMDTAKDRLENYNKKMKELAQSKEGPLVLISVVLTLILIFLVVWVIL